MAQETNTNRVTETWREAAPVRSLAAVLIIIAVFVLLAMAVSLTLGDWPRIRAAFSRYSGGVFAQPQNQAPILRERPRIQVDEHADLATYRQAEHQRLHAYGRTKEGNVQIPIERAMKIVVEKGLPARKGD